MGFIFFVFLTFLYVFFLGGFSLVSSQALKLGNPASRRKTKSSLRVQHLEAVDEGMKPPKWIGCIYMDVSKNRGKTPKMDGL